MAAARVLKQDRGLSLRGASNAGFGAVAHCEAAAAGLLDGLLQALEGAALAPVAEDLVHHVQRPCNRDRKKM